MQALGEYKRQPQKRLCSSVQESSRRGEVKGIIRKVVVVIGSVVVGTVVVDFVVLNSGEGVILCMGGRHGSQFERTLSHCLWLSDLFLQVTRLKLLHQAQKLAKT